MSNVISATSSNLIPIGALFSAAWARLSRAWLGFGLLLLLAPLGILVASLFVAALAIGALGIIHGKDFALGLFNPFRFYTFASIAENRRILMILAVLAGFLSLRWLGVLWKAATHLSLTPELGFSKALREGNRDSSYFLIHILLSLILMNAAGALLVIPGLAVMVFLGFSGLSFARDKSGVFGAFKQSFLLSKPHFWPLFVRMLVLGIVSGILMIVPVIGWVLGPALWLCALGELFERISPRQAALEVPATPAIAGLVEAAHHEAGLDQIFLETWTIFKETWWQESLILVAGLAMMALALGAASGGAWLAAEQWKAQAIWIYVVGAVLGSALLLGAAAWSYASVLSQAFAPHDSPLKAMKDAGSKTPAMFYLFIVGGLLVAGALILGIIPGLYLGLGFLFAPQLLVRENKTPLQALSASLELVRGRFWKILGFSLVIMLAGSVLGSVPLVGSVFAFLLWVALFDLVRKNRESKQSPGNLRTWSIVSALGWLLLIGGAAYLVARPPAPVKSAWDQVRLMSQSLPDGFESSWGNQFSLPEPEYIAADMTGASGALWVMGGPHVKKYLKILRTDGTFAWVAGEHSQTQFGFAGPIVADPRGFFYHSDSGFHTVQKLRRDGTRAGKVLEPSKDGLTGTAHGPMGLALDKEGNLYVAEMYNHRVQKLGPDGEYLAHWGHPDSETATKWSPYSIAAGAGRVFVSDMQGRSVDIFDSLGNSLGVWSGKEDRRVGGFQNVRQMALRANGRILVAETDRVLEFGPDLALIGIWKGGAEKGWNADGVAAAPDGRVFIVDKKHHRILITRNPPPLR